MTYKNIISDCDIAHEANKSMVKLNGVEYIVVEMSYEDFIRVKGGIDMDDIVWTYPEE